MSESDGPSLTESFLAQKNHELRVEDDRLKNMFGLVVPHLPASENDQQNPQELEVVSIGGGFAMAVEGEALSRQFPNMHYTGIEIDTEILRQTKEYYEILQQRGVRTDNPNITFTEANAELPETFRHLPRTGLVIIRNPDIQHGNWFKIYENAYNALINDGILFSTATEQHNYKKIEKYFQRLGIKPIRAKEDSNQNGLNPYRAHSMTTYSPFLDTYYIMGKKQESGKIA